MKLRQIIMLSILAVLPAISGCSGEPEVIPDSSVSEYSDRASSPFDSMSDTVTIETPKLQYLGSKDLTDSPAYELYIKSYAPDYVGDVIEWERVSARNLANRLTERISSDLSPDLCDKIGNSLPYLAKRNLYEDLTGYIDITAPQWIPYAEYITSAGAGKGQYFYPASITVSPYVLLYKKSAFPRYNTANPLTLWNDGEWTLDAMTRSLGNSSVRGTAVAENLLASSGISLFSVDKNGKVTSNLHSEVFSDSARIIAGCTNPQNGQTGLKSGIEALQSGEILYLSINEVELSEVRRTYPDSGLEIVPFPRGDSADKHYYYALAEGYLVPKRAGNIKGAASFINCARIAAENSGDIFEASSELTESDVRTLSVLRSTELSQAIFDTNYCLDADANSAVSGIFAGISSNGDDAQALDEFIRNIEAPILRSISEINQNSDK